MPRLVCMADTHLYHEDLDIPDGDILIHAGDLTKTGTLAQLEVMHEFLAALPHSHKLIIAGNHDWSFQRDPAAARAVFRAGTYVQDEMVEIEGLKFYGSPWQPEFHSWAFNVPRGEKLARIWSRIPDDTDVLVTHGPPMGIGDRCEMENRAGCADLLHRVLTVKPRLHLFGHIHQDRGHWTLGETTFVNVTVDECLQAPTVIDLEGDRVTVHQP